jgi:uncharacterized Zn-finger protein
MAALATMPATARLSFARFITRKPVLFCSLKMVCHLRDTTAPTKEGLSENDKIVSNLHEQNEPLGHLGIIRSPQYGARRFELLAHALIAFAPKFYQGELTMADQVVPHFHNDAGVPVIEIGSQEFMCVGANPPFDHPHVFLDLGNDNEIICPYCSTLYRFAADLKAGEARPPECVLKDKVA